MNQPDVTSKDRFLSSRQRYQEIVNKASCLSLVSNAILYWNTIKIAETVGRLRAQGEAISVSFTSPMSLRPVRSGWKSSREVTEKCPQTDPVRVSQVQ